MAVVGIDYGNLDCVVAQAKRGGIDIILNENTNRKNPNMVCLNGKQRLIGEAASSVARMQFKNTAICVKRLIGKKFSEPEAQEEMKDLPLKFTELENGYIGVTLNYNDTPTVFSCEQLTSMMLKKLKLVASAANEGVAISYVVISVPGYFTNTERRALINASKIAGFNCLRLMNEHTSVALAYGIYKSARNLFHESEPQHVMFIDMGHSSYTVTIVAFVQGKLEVKSFAFDRRMGGRSFDSAIAGFLAEEFKAKHKRDPLENAKSKMKLLTASEKAKKNLSPQGVQMTNVRVECLVEEMDLDTKLSLEKFEELIEPYLGRLEAPINQALADAGIEKSDLACVEIVGGSTRVASVKKRLSELLGLDSSKNNYGLSTTLNADESVARGCALQCAILSPVFKVKEFQIADTVTFPVRVSWDQDSEMDTSEDGDEATAPAGNSIVILDRKDDFPKIKRVTFRRAQPFEVRAEYDESADAFLPPQAEKNLGTFTVTGIPPVAEGEEVPRIRVNMKQDLHGLFSVSSSQLMQEIKEEPKEDAEAEKKEGEDGKEADSKEEAKPEEPKKKRFRKIDLQIEAKVGGMSEAEINAAVEEETKMAQQDRMIEETANTRNELESYVYDMRNKICDQLKDFINDSDRSEFDAKLQEVEDWLYTDEGFDSTKAVYADKLAELQGLGSPVVLRMNESSSRPAAVTELLALTEEYKKLVNSTDEKYAHWSDADRDIIRIAVKNGEEWINEKLDIQNSLKPSDVAAVTSSQIHARMKEIRDACRAVLTKPAPKPEPKVEAPKEDAPKDSDAPKAEADSAEADMDLD